MYRRIHRGESLYHHSPPIRSCPPLPSPEAATSLLLGQRLVDFFCKGPDSKSFQQSLSILFSATIVAWKQPETICEWIAQVCSNKTLFKRIGCQPRLSFANWDLNPSYSDQQCRHSRKATGNSAHIVELPSHLHSDKMVGRWGCAEGVKIIKT